MFKMLWDVVQAKMKSLILDTLILFYPDPKPACLPMA